MLRSFTRHFNETVFRGPDMEGGSDGGGDLETDIGTGGRDVDSGSPDRDREGGGGGGEGKPRSGREEIKKAIADASAPLPDKKAKKDPKSGRFVERPPKGQKPAPKEGGETG